MSTVAVEQQFNVDDYILDASRSSMSPDSIEGQTCLDDWTKVEFQQQELDQKQRMNTSKMIK